jgi:hypothetical protein
MIFLAYGDEAGISFRLSLLFLQCWKGCQIIRKIVKLSEWSHHKLHVTVQGSEFIQMFSSIDSMYNRVMGFLQDEKKRVMGFGKSVGSDSRVIEIVVSVKHPYRKYLFNMYDVDILSGDISIFPV